VDIEGVSRPRMLYTDREGVPVLVIPVGSHSDASDDCGYITVPQVVLGQVIRDDAKWRLAYEVGGSQVALTVEAGYRPSSAAATATDEWLASLTSTPVGPPEGYQHRLEEFASAVDALAELHGRRVAVSIEWMTAAYWPAHLAGTLACERTSGKPVDGEPLRFSIGEQADSSFTIDSETFASANLADPECLELEMGEIRISVTAERRACAGGPNA